MCFNICTVDQLASPLVKGIAAFSKHLLGESKAPYKQTLSNHVDEKAAEDEPSADEHVRAFFS